jgi:hypothetical protein
MRRATAFAALVPMLLTGLALLAWFAYTVLAPGGSAAAPVASSSLTCSVKDSACGGDEVEVFRMSNTANAHAGTPAGSTYGKVVCCGGVTGLGDSCSGTYDTVLTLSGTNNAHVASDSSYATKACLSVGAGTVDCTYGDTCGGYACLATISGSTNAHVADCDGSNDYTTKVCCTATGGGGPVGGIAELPDVSGPSDHNYVPLAAALVAALLALTAGGWCARRRWGR